MVHYHHIRASVMDNVVQGPLAGSMYNWDTDVDSKNSRPCAIRKFPARPAGVEAIGDGPDSQHTSILAVGRAGVDDCPAIGRKLVKAWVKVIHEVTDGGGRGFGQRYAGWVDIGRRTAEVGILYPE